MFECERASTVVRIDIYFHCIQILSNNLGFKGHVLFILRQQDREAAEVNKVRDNSGK